MGYFFHFSSLCPAPYIALNCICVSLNQISYLNFKAVLALPKMTRSAQTHKSISFIWIVLSTLYVYLWAFPHFFALDPFLTFCSKSSKNAYKFKWEAFRAKSWSHFSCNFFGGTYSCKKMGILISKMSDNTIYQSTFATIS